MSDSVGTCPLEKQLGTTIEQVVESDQNVLFDKLTKYVDTSLAPFSELLKKAERLSLASQSALATSKQTQDELQHIKDAVLDFKSQLDKHAQQMTEISNKIAGLESENQRLVLDTKSALDKSESVSATLTAQLDQIKSTQEQASHHMHIMDTIRQDHANLKEHLQNLGAELYNLRNSLPLRRSRV